MKTNDLKKGDKVLVLVSGMPCPALIDDNRKGNIRYCMVYGSQIGGVDESGSVYSHNIVYKVEGKKTIKIEHTPAQLKLKIMASIF